MAAMEDVLEVYQRPYDPLRPVVCIDETNKQLIKEDRIPCGPGNPEKVDSVYVRNGVADVFMISEPLANQKYAQLVFTTHDSWQLSASLLRRDEIWFTEKDNSGVSSLYSLADFVDEDGIKIRKEFSCVNWMTPLDISMSSNVNPTISPERIPSRVARSSIA